MKEFELISKYFKPLAKGFKGALALKDDIAIFPKNNTHEYIITTDGMVEGVHFPENSMPDVVASRLLASNLSDIASCGGVPKYYLITGSIKEGMNKKWFKNFSDKLAEINKKYGIHLIGGDTVKSSTQLFFSVTLIGEVETGRALLRSNAMTGDDIYVSGNIGDAWIGLQILNGEFEKLSYDDKNYFINRYVSPTPRIELGKALVGVASSCTDISDGLLKDLENICTASHVAAEIKKEKISVAIHGEHFEEQITGGDDYELIFTANPSKKGKIENISRDLGLKITKIGKIQTKNTNHSEKSQYITITDRSGKIINYSKTGYEHEI